jgi:hypothetical protein
LPLPQPRSGARTQRPYSEAAESDDGPF